ncbi:hypothetical protein Alg130_00654 [Pyrenophora tritici-repentis]|nr:hypothetical protein Alg130_00654 [Pyrenophora tritici-repentis]KAI0614222.1 MatE multi-domain protein [Pyrenophora tritici-repentis]KAI1605656.1 hypothetical protein PtrCC142_002139 [Pyrenophora tritici-repentis]
MAPLTTEEEVEIVAPLWDVQPAVVSTKKQQRQQNAPPADIYANEDKHFDTEEYEYDISSLALSFVPLPFTSGGGGSGCYTAAYYRTMDAPEARRFSTSTAERVGLLKSSAAKNHSQYGAVMADPAEIEIGTDELGAVSLATMTANITGLAIYEGLATSLDTLCAQAYGSGKKTMVGLHLQRMVLFMLAVTIPIGAVWLCSGWILAALVPEKELAHLAGYYLSLLLAGAPGYAIFEAGKRFTQAQGLFNASLFVLLIATPVNIALNYVFVFVLNWDLTGAALATVISNNLLPLLLWIYVYFVNPASLECWGGFTKAAFTNWGPMARLTVPGIVMVETEWLAFDILTFSTSYLSTTHLAAQSMYVPPPIPPQPN